MIEDEIYRIRLEIAENDRKEVFDEIQKAFENRTTTLSRNTIIWLYSYLDFFKFVLTPIDNLLKEDKEK